jgi:hypothetical protein
VALTGPPTGTSQMGTSAVTFADEMPAVVVALVPSRLFP